MTGKIMTFYLGGSLCGIDIAFAREINRNISYTPVLGGVPYVVGLLNLRGQIVTLFDLVRLLKLTKQDTKESQCIILKKPFRGDSVGFLIDRPGEVVDITPAMCELPPANVKKLQGKFIAEVAKSNQEIILILDVEKLADAL